jgi:WD40 repeat protein
MARDMGLAGADIAGKPLESAGSRYAAFISYSHADEAFVKWLHRRLETYEIPKALAMRRSGDHPRRLGKVFRDRVELSASNDLGRELRAALDQSEALIVVCSPRAAASQHVNEEIRYFKEARKNQQIFAIILTGEPHAASKSGHSNQECFPRALLCKVSPDGRISNDLEDNEPVAADARPQKDGRDLSALKLIAGLLGTGLDDLVLREKQAQRERDRRRNIVGLLVAVLAFGVIVAGLLAWSQGDSVRLQALAAEREKVEGAKQRKLADENEAAALQSRRLAYASRASDKNKDFDYLSAVRYALAGLRLAPANAEQYLAVLSVSLHEATDSIPFLHQDMVRNAAFSPDGSHIATATSNGKIALWDVKTKRVVFTAVHPGIEQVEFSSDGKTIISQSHQPDGSVKFWSTQNGELIRTMDPHFGEDVAGIFYFPERERVLTYHYEGGVQVWNTQTNSLVASMAGHGTSHVGSASFSPDGRKLVTATWGEAKVWTVQDGQLAATLEGHTGDVADATFSPDGRRIVTAGDDETAKIWDAASGRLIATMHGHRGPVSTAMFSPDGQTVVTAGGGKVRVWNAQTAELLAAFSGHSGPIESICFSRDGQQIVTASLDQTARVWLSAGRLPRTLSTRDDNRGVVSLSSDGSLAVTIGEGRAVNLWDVASGQLRRTIPSRDPDITAAAFAPGDKSVATADAWGATRIWDVATGKLISTFEVNGADLDYSPDGKLLLIPNPNSSVAILNVETGKISSLEQHKDGVTGGRFSPDGRLFVTASFDGTALVWDTAEQRVLQTFKHKGEINAVRFSPDSRRIVTASSDQTAKVWNLENAELVTTLVGHRGIVTDAAFAPTGAIVATSGEDGTAKIWNANDGALLATLRGNGKAVRTVVFSSDGRRLVTNGEDGSAKLWDVSRLTQGRAELERDACASFLQPSDRKFSEMEIDADPMLKDEWPPDRDVCEGVSSG